MELFYGNPSGHLIVPQEDELNHLIKVKRASRGDTVFLTDGQGHLFETIVSSIDKKNCSLEIVSTQSFSPRKNALHIAVAPTKNMDRIEWFLEKATETGIEEISFLKCRHSERKEIKTERLMRVMISSMKQSVKYFLPKINPMIDFSSFIEKTNTGNRYIFTMTAQKKNNLKSLYKNGESLTAVIGPEGDFHMDEINEATQGGFISASLGESRLRTETAALSVCTIFNFINEQ
jgi:16S rRNA (uracil1498-N3)-methyltransferase